MIIDFEKIKQKIDKAKSFKDLEDIYKDVFSKNGILSQEMKKLSIVSIEEKKIIGKELNLKKSKLQNLFNLKTEELKIKFLEQQMIQEKVDLTLPVQKLFQGSLHPISYVTDNLVAIFSELGFKITQANEIEEDWYNFTALNIVEHHPSRQDHDTFYLNSKDQYGNRKLLRTHTSNAQVRTMIKEKDLLKEGKPIKIISSGRTYRRDNDSTHSPMFHQMEGLYIDKKDNISIPLLKSILEYFCSKFFGIKGLSMNFRPSYFPFTSPSYEIDILCDKTKDQLIIGKGSDWLEILGSGIVHDNVLENCGIDSKIYSGLAFGMGIERVTMLKYGFKDLRSMFNSDKRWLEYYNFKLVNLTSMCGSLD